ncbi:MAG: phosphocarrier protein HPr [Gammaproteobacteria bacterium]|jgi:phosphocarrier protein HPr
MSHQSTVTIINKLGLHARAATRLVQTAGEFEADFFVSKDGKEVNGKSILGVMMLAAAKGTKITVRCEGDDAESAHLAIVSLINDRFGEAE